MLNFGNKEFRNLQEQVEKNAQDIQKGLTGIKISYWVATVQDLSPLMKEENVGKYIIVNNNTLYTITHRANEGLIAINLGSYPAGTQGPAGEQGEQGEVGPKGNSIYGVGTELPSVTDYHDGDFYLLSNGNLYKAVGGQWLLQCSIKGAQGPIGPNGTPVEGNPVASATDALTKIKINGVVYSVTNLTSAQKQIILDFATNAEWKQDGSIEFGHDVYADGNLQAGYDVEVGRNLYVDDLNKIQDPEGNPIVANAIATIKSDSYQKVDTTVYPTLESFLASTGQEGIQYLYPKTYEGETVTAYYKYIWEGSAWVSLGTTDGGTYIDAYTKAQSDARYVNLTDAQTKAGVLTLTNGLKTQEIHDGAGTGLYIKTISGAKSIQPRSWNDTDIGTLNAKWKNLFLSGNISDGTNSVSVANISNGLLPSYPSSTGTFVLKCVNGTLTWVAE